MPPSAPPLEPRDFALIDAALKILEATILCRSHMATTDRTLAELQRLVERERDTIAEKIARDQWREIAAEREQSAADRLIGRRPAAP
jgi:hypothetical protein